MLAKIAAKTNIVFLKKKYGKYMPVTFFLLGFLFDIVTSGRIDQDFTLIQQGVFLFLVGLLLYLEMWVLNLKLAVPRWTAWLWERRIEIIHFLLGSLLSAYTIFYFKSTSLLGSSLFFFFVAGLLVANELPRFKGQGIKLRFGLFSLCVLSFLNYLVPIFVGNVGVIPFLLAWVLSFLVSLFFFKSLAKKGCPKKVLLADTVAPSAVIKLIFLALYFTHSVPPVPLSIQYMGVYHNVQREGSTYTGTFYRDWWRLWENGSQTFRSRPGDRVYLFARIFSPTEFSDEVRVRWLKKNKRGDYKTWDVIPINIVGGRDEGFRGYVYKSNYEAGLWQVRIETTDEREIGRIYFEVVDDETQDERVGQVDFF